MYQRFGWWFPDQDQHFVEMLEKNISKGGEAVYQAPVRMASIDLTQQRRIALDIGANVGLWSRDLCAAFQHVHAFEPVDDFRACLQQNVTYENFTLHPCALGAAITQVDMIITEHNTGHSHVDVNTIGRGKTPMVTLDSMSLSCVDYIKIDCEGYENQIIQGGEGTIRSQRPIIVIEDKGHQDVGHTDTGSALQTLLSWGMRRLRTVRNDHIMGW